MKFYFLIFLLLSPIALSAQVLSNKITFTEADTLRGSLRPERSYDVQKYHLNVRVEPDDRFISGYNTISFKAEEDLPVMQVDLFQNMKVDSILYKGEKMKFNRRYNAVFVDLQPKVTKNSIDSIQFFYSGNPKVAKMHPGMADSFLTRTRKEIISLL